VDGTPILDLVFLAESSISTPMFVNTDVEGPNNPVNKEILSAHQPIPTYEEEVHPVSSCTMNMVISSNSTLNSPPK
jgi:hypothetical protein